jgi:Protein of unknown function (DUF3631)
VVHLNLDDYFGSWNDGKGMSPWTLSNQLKRYRIGPKKIRVGDKTLQGYRRDQFTDVWVRYGAPNSGTPEQSSPRAKSDEKSPEHGEEMFRSESGENPDEHGDVPMFRSEEGGTPRKALASAQSGRRAWGSTPARSAGGVKA